MSSDGDVDGGSDGMSADFPTVVESGKLDGTKKAVTKVVRTGENGAKMVMMVDKDEQNDLTMFVAMFREGARYRAAETVFREAGGGETGWDAVEQFLPGSDTDPRFRAALLAGLMKNELHPAVTVQDVIDWEESEH